MSKVIVCDWGILSHRAIFATAHNPGVPATYTCLSMMIGNLKRIGVTPDDTIIVAVDSRGSWRKEYEKEYKGDRAKKRKESNIDWTKEYSQMEWLLQKLEEATKFHIIKIDHLEADDIMAVASRYYKDKEVVLVTYDSDLDQCWSYPNVKIFSPMTKRYKIVPPKFDVYKFIAKKCEKEASDNMVNPILNQQDYDNRMICVNLLELPDWVENAITHELDNLPEKEENIELIPFNSLRDRFPKIYNPGKDLVTYEKCIKFEERRKNKAKKKAKTKRSKK